MRTIWIALAALVGFVVSFLMIFALGISLTSSSECDGPCFSEWGKVSWTAIAIGLAVAVLLGVAVVRWKQSGFEVGLGIGLSVGYATVGRVGFEGYYGYAAVGSVMNLAARLCALALPGQIVVSQPVFARLQESVIAEPRGTFELKGFSRPIDAYSVTSLVSNGATSR
jgi:class 3 adenylate cyclase